MLLSPSFIIVLLILAVVAISAVSGDGILRHAQNSADQYNDAQIRLILTLIII